MVFPMAAQGLVGNDAKTDSSHRPSPDLEPDLSIFKDVLLFHKQGIIQSVKFRYD